MKNEEFAAAPASAKLTHSSFLIPHSSSIMWLAVVGLTGLRLSLVGKGALAFVDEQRYVTAMLGLRALGEGHGREFLQAINSMGARPGDGLWRVIPGLGQAVLLLAFRLNPNAPPSLQVPQVFNVLILSLSAVLLYKIYRQFFSLGFALVGVALYSSLVNTNVYLRHLLPYDHALFFFLLALWLLLTAPEATATRRQWVVGGLSGFSYAVYPGYFMGPAVLLALGVLLAVAPKLGAGHRLKQVRIGPVVAQLAGSVTVLVSLELLARFSDTSYLASSRYIATTVTQGSFTEGFSFVSTYFWQVEGWAGGSLLVLGGAGLGLSIREFLRGPAPSSSGPTKPVVLTGLLVLGFVAWLGYAGLVQGAHQFVFYGRILHFFAPFIVLGAVAALQNIARRWPPGKPWLLAGGGAVALWHFGTFVTAYRAVAYPCDVVYARGIHDARQIISNQTTGCDNQLVTYRVFGPRIRGQRTTAEPRYRLVNFAYLYPLSCYRAAGTKGSEVVASVPYFMKYAPYQFEGHDAVQRMRLRDNPYEFQILRAK